MCHRINVVTIRTTSQSGCFQWDGTTASKGVEYAWHPILETLYSGLQGRFFNFYICRSKMTVRGVIQIIFSFFDSIESQIKLCGQFFVRCLRMTLGIISHPYQQTGQAKHNWVVLAFPFDQTAFLYLVFGWC